MFKPIEELSPEQAQDELNQLTGPPESGYWDSSKWDHKEIHERVTQLYQRINPEDPALAGASEGLQSLAPHVEGKVTAEDISDAQDALENVDNARVVKKVEDDLKLEWGRDYDAKIESARAVYSQLTEEHQSMIAESGLSNDPEFVKKLAEIAAMIRLKAKK